MLLNYVSVLMQRNETLNLYIGRDINDIYICEKIEKKGKLQ